MGMSVVRVENGQLFSEKQPWDKKKKDERGKENEKFFYHIDLPFRFMLENRIFFIISFFRPKASLAF